MGIIYIKFCAFTARSTTIYAKFVPLNCYATERNLLNITEIQCKDKGYQVSRVNAVHNLKGTQSSILPPATAVKVNILP